MDTERSHSHRSTSNNNSSTSELFVCFTSRLSSSSMKLSSKSILSPNRNRDPPQISLSSSLSRRLKSNGSMKGGQASPMFPTGGGKRRGVGFENPEPSSPKVTCIGQVRVKTKKQGKKMRSRSKRRGEASFRRGSGEVGGNPDLTRQNSQSFQYQNHQSLQQECLKHRNQRWVHLPLTICEALREFSCFFPCRSSCMSSEREKEKGREEEGKGGSGGGNEREGSCGFARWLVALQDGDGKGRRIELVMEHENEHEMEMEMEMDDEDDEREKGERSHSQRRHIFEDLDIDLVEGKEDGEVEEEKGRVSICIPPKNALLLMRCRSDPVKMAALANRFWESPIHKEQDNVVVSDENQDGEEQVDDIESTGDEEDEQEGNEDEGEKDLHIEMEQVEEPEAETEQQLVVESERREDDSICERETEAHVVEQEEVEAELEEQSKTENRAKEEFSEEPMEEKDENEHKVETITCVLLSEEAHQDLEKPETEEKGTKEEENDEIRELSSSPETCKASETENDEASEEPVTEGSTEEEEEKATSPEKEEVLTNQGSESLQESTEREKESKEEQRNKERETLPECLLLMMCEPKLSMEVSKETWVCSTDFIRYLPERPTGKPVAGVAGGEKKVTVESSSSMPSKQKAKSKSKPPLMQPPRSSCSFPVTGGGTGMSMAMMIEQKLMGSSKSRNGYEPFVLTRCKSEPMRSATKLAAPEACFWNNRKLEPHPPPASVGVGAPAGVGF